MIEIMIDDEKLRKIATEDNEMMAYYRKYAKGIITRQELEDMMTAKGLKGNKLDNDLEDKLNKEYEEFIHRILERPKESIVVRAYEIVSKAEIKHQLLNMPLHDKEKAVLIDTEDVLDAFYEDWLNTDIHFGEMMNDIIEDSVATATKYYNKQGNFKPAKYTLDYFEDLAKKRGMIEDSER